MAEATKIEWTDATVNFWWGCTKVGPGCDHCYAESLDRRLGGRHWGPRAARKPIENASNTMVKLNRRSARRIAEGLPPIKVFVQSMADIFDNEVPDHWRAEAFETMQLCTHLRIQLLTKRVGNVESMIPAAWRYSGFPAHVGLMITVVNQEEADRDVPKLLALKEKLDIPWVGLSIEPMLGPVDLERVGTKQSIGASMPAVLALQEREARTRDISGLQIDVVGLPGNATICFQTPDHMGGFSNHFPRPFPRLDWVICGGESGPDARPMHPDWARSLRDQCALGGVPFLFKQWGSWAVEYDRDADDPDWKRCPRDNQARARYLNLAGGHGFHGERVLFVRRVDKARAGRTLDGVTHDEFPKELMR
jgi:protein gp37